MSKVTVLSHRDIRNSQAGGASLYVHEIFKRLATEYNVTIVSLASHGLPTKERIDGMDILRLPFSSISRISLPISVITRLSGKSDLLIDNGDVAFPWFTPLYTRKPLISIIYQIVGNIFDYELAKPFAALAKRTEPWAYKAYKKSRIVTCSPSTKTDLVSFGIPEKNISVVRPGIDQSLFANGYPVEKFSDPTIVCISRFKRYKGLHFAIGAMKHVLAQIPNAKLIIVGNGNDLETRNEVFKEGLGSSVNILRRAPHSWNQQKRALLAGAHLALVPSVREGYGIVVIEANACGTAAIGWNVAGIRDSIIDGQTGTLVPFGDRAMLGEQILSLLENKTKRDAMVRNARKWAMAHSWDKAAQEFGKVIDFTIPEEHS